MAFFFTFSSASSKYCTHLEHKSHGVTETLFHCEPRLSKCSPQPAVSEGKLQCGTVEITVCKNMDIGSHVIAASVTQMCWFHPPCASRAGERV